MLESYFLLLDCASGLSARCWMCHAMVTWAAPNWLEWHSSCCCCLSRSRWSRDCTWIQYHSPRVADIFLVNPSETKTVIRWAWTYPSLSCFSARSRQQRFPVAPNNPPRQLRAWIWFDWGPPSCPAPRPSSWDSKRPFANWWQHCFSVKAADLWSWVAR